MPYITRKIKARRELGKRLANIRWDRDRAMRARMAAMDPVKFAGHVVKRIIVIEEETTAREICFFDFDTYTDRRRKLRAVHALEIP